VERYLYLIHSIDNTRQFTAGIDFEYSVTDANNCNAAWCITVVEPRNIKGCIIKLLLVMMGVATVTNYRRRWNFCYLPFIGKHRIHYTGREQDFEYITSANQL
jgi:hypothetical protein